MADLKTNYAGLELKNPLLVGSSGLTGSVETIKTIADSGAGAVVLKSIFEEEIMREMEATLPKTVLDGYNIEQYDHYNYTIKQNNLKKYIELIQDAKKVADVPMIASINCLTNLEWLDFAVKLQDAGADALELNMFILPSDFERNSKDTEKIYFDIIEKIKPQIKIPLILKVSHYFSNLAAMMQKLSKRDIDALVLFNRFYNLDFDIDSLEVQTSNVLSNPYEISLPLRWISILANRVECDLCASTGVHDGKGLIKMLLAGANAVQIVSTIYKNGPSQIKVMLDELNKWMDSKGYNSIADFRGKMAQETSENPAIYERVQFMKYFGEKEKYETN